MFVFTHIHYFVIGDHGDQYKFDAGGNITNILAHTFYPNYHEMGTLNGDIHFDDYEKWILDGSTSTGTHFPYVLVHEIGHALGLGHSKRQEAVMNPIYKRDALDAIQLDLDDKCAINWNYSRLTCIIRFNVSIVFSVGPTNMCLFVWLMAEILPRAGDSVTTSPGASTGSNNCKLCVDVHLDKKSFVVSSNRIVTNVWRKDAR